MKKIHILHENPIWMIPPIIPLLVTPTNSSQSDTLKVKCPLLVKYTLTPTQNIVENLVADW
jgi:hypothetical protein